jgi:hypothetical protein
MSHVIVFTKNLNTQSVDAFLFFESSPGNWNNIPWSNSVFTLASSSEVAVGNGQILYGDPGK